MTEKSHVAMGAEICPVCLEPHNEVVVLNRTLKATLPPKINMGWSLCAEHQRQKEEGFILLVEVSQEVHTLNDASQVRTGRAVSIRASVWEDMMNAPPPPDQFGFILPGFIEKIEEASGTSFAEDTKAPTVH